MAVRGVSPRRPSGYGLAVLAGSLILAGGLTVQGTPARAQQGSLVSVSVPAGSLESGLLALGRQANLKLVYASALTAGRQTGGVSGQFSRQSAVAQVLAGTGLSYSFTGANAVRIYDPNAGGGNDEAATVEGAIALDTVDVTGAGGGAQPGEPFTPDTPFATAGSVSHISREQIDRVPPISAGDVFRSTPGVISAGNRVGTSINPNIRGLQGMGRVNTTIDGARQTTSTYRGYIGNRDETYVDPDMIGGVDITKGPSDGVGVGSIGGNVAFRTLLPEDIVKPGQAWGARLRGSLGNNTVGDRAISRPPPGSLVNDSINLSNADRPSFFNGDTLSGSIALATVQENYEFVAAYSRRTQGNYFAGTKVPNGIIFDRGPGRNALIRPGEEVFNTSEDAESFLAKGKLKWGDGHSLQLGYTYYGSQYGEVNELFLTFAQQSNILPYGQFPLSETDVHTYTGQYEYNPADNPFIHVRANLWHSDLDASYSFVGGPHAMRASGFDGTNRSTIEMAFGRVTWSNGLELVREEAWAQQYESTVTGSDGWETGGPSGVRNMLGGFSKASLDVSDWLTVSAGVRYDHYESRGAGYLTKFPERSGERLSPNAGIVVKPTEGIQIFGQYTEGYRPPSLRETHWHYQGLLWNNPYLKGEVARNTEIGINVLRDNVFADSDKLRFKAAWFNNNYDDYIVRLLGGRHNGQFLPRPPQAMQTYHWFNIDRADFSGFEISGSYDAGWLFVEGAFTKYISMEYCHDGVCITPPVTSADGVLGSDYASNYIPPEYSGSVTAGVRLFEQKLTFGGRVNFSSTRMGNVWPPVGQGVIGAGTHTWPAHTTYDLFGSYKFTEDVVLNFSVENITDEYYFGALTSTGVPSPGRTGRASLTLKF